MDKMYKHTAKIIEDCTKNSWSINLFDQRKEERFMSKFYKDSSIYQAFSMIHNEAKAAAGDIWRYAALYAFGNNQFQSYKFTRNTKQLYRWILY